MTDLIPHQLDATPAVYDAATLAVLAAMEKAAGKHLRAIRPPVWLKCLTPSDSVVDNDSYPILAFMRESTVTYSNYMPPVGGEKHQYFPLEDDCFRSDGEAHPEHDYPPVGEGDECRRCGAEAGDD
ncbi:hypothetical protein [Streptomyces sp. CC224B]|uniref:hypothetical protein n=1 Tax=Streptomyces sp. CC224B TaxID=3044571 RepID=UPI0024A92211|nr:hypothetical protein [Streptomyces sp. CC224B]